MTERKGERMFRAKKQENEGEISVRDVGVEKMMDGISYEKFKSSNFLKERRSDQKRGKKDDK